MPKSKPRHRYKREPINWRWEWHFIKNRWYAFIKPELRRQARLALQWLRRSR